MSNGNKTHVQLLLEGQTIKFRPHGNSMVPIVYSGQLVTVSPVFREILVGDTVLCKVHGHQMLHLVSAIGSDQMLHLVSAIGSDGRYQISNNHGHVNGWCTRQNVFGILVAVEP